VHEKKETLVPKSCMQQQYLLVRVTLAYPGERYNVSLHNYINFLIHTVVD